MQTILEIYGSFYQVGLTSVIFMLTFWRQRYATALERGPSRKKEFSASKAFPMEDVKKLQSAFSGPQPGSWADWLSGDKKRKSKSKWNHLTLNDILCTVSIGVDDHVNPANASPCIRSSLMSLQMNWITAAEDQG